MHDSNRSLRLAVQAGEESQGPVPYGRGAVLPSPDRAPSATVRAPRRAAERPPAVVLVTLLALAALLRFHHLGQENFWIDEVSSMLVARQPLADIAFNYRPGMHPDRGAEQAPLALMVMHVFLDTNASEASARIPSALFGIAAVALLYFAAARMVTPPVAFLAALLLCISPLHVWYSQEARWYAQWIVLTMLSYWALLRARDGGGIRAWIAYAVCSVLNVYTFILSFLLIAAQGLSVLLFDRWRERRPAMLPRFILAQAAILIACAPVLWMIFKTLGLSTGTPRPKGWADLPYTFFIYAVGYSMGPTTQYLHAMPGLRNILSHYPAILVPGVVFAPLIAFGLRRTLQDRRLAALLIPWCFAPPLLAFIVSRFSHVTYQARYSSAAIPAFLLLVALGVDALRHRWFRAFAVAALVASSAWSLTHYYWDPQYAKEDVKGAVAFVDSVGGGLPIAVVGQVDSAVEYYGPHLRVVSLKTCTTGAELAAPARFWLLAGRDWDEAAPGCLDYFGRTNTLADHQEFSGVDLWLFTPIETDAGKGLPRQEVGRDPFAPSAEAGDELPSIEDPHETPRLPGHGFTGRITVPAPPQQVAPMRSL